jgi:phage tail-like protein
MRIRAFSLAGLIALCVGLAPAAPAAASGGDPVANFRFRVEIDGLAGTRVLMVEGIATETEVLRYREGGSPLERKLPGPTHVGDLVLRRGFDGGLDWWQWRRSVVAGPLERRSVSVQVLNRDGEEIARFNAAGAWPSAYRLYPLDADGGRVLVEELVLAVEGFEAEAR